MSLELKISEVVELPKIMFNYDELKKELEIKANDYINRIYTEENIKEAKEDRAKLNNLVKTINDQKIVKKKEYLEEYNKFEDKIKEIMEIIKKASEAIDKQVKEVEEKQKEEKRAKIKEIFDKSVTNEFIKINKVFNDKWLNVTTTLANIEKELIELDCKCNNDIEIIRGFKSSFETSLIAKYEETMDLGTVIKEKTRLEEIEVKNSEIKQEKARRSEIIQTNDEVTLKANRESTVGVIANYHRAFEVWGSREQIIALGDFMNNNNIKFKKIEGVN